MLSFFQTSPDAEQAERTAFRASSLDCSRTLALSARRRGKVGPFTLSAHTVSGTPSKHLQRGGVAEDLRMRLKGQETRHRARRYTQTEIEQLRAAVSVLPDIEG